jgi:hypothetical protein
MNIGWPLIPLFYSEYAFKGDLNNNYYLKNSKKYVRITVSYYWLNYVVLKLWGQNNSESVLDKNNKKLG